MVSAAIEEEAAATQDLPDYLLDPNAVLGDKSASWRYGEPPDYTNTRRVFEETKSKSHTPGSLPDLVQNLVKNWEIEASFKTQIDDWRTVDKDNYTFAINGGPPQSAEHMLKVGTYNAIIAPNEFYSPETSDFASSHKTFKRMMPTFAWEVLEVYSGPPVASFKWRHWGVMKNDYVGYNDKGEKVTAKAHGGPIDIQGVTVAHLNDQLRVVKLETWFDPLEMFRQIAPNGIVNKSIEARSLPLGISSEPQKEENIEKREETVAETLEEKGVSEIKDVDEVKTKGKDQAAVHETATENVIIPFQETVVEQSSHKFEEQTKQSHSPSQQVDLRKLITHLTSALDALKHGLNLSQGVLSSSSPATSTAQSWTTVHSEDENDTQADTSASLPADKVETDKKDVPGTGSATVTSPTDVETQLTHQEMSNITKPECPFFNRE